MRRTQPAQPPRGCHAGAALRRGARHCSVFEPYGHHRPKSTISPATTIVPDPALRCSLDELLIARDGPASFGDAINRGRMAIMPPDSLPS